MTAPALLEARNLSVVVDGPERDLPVLEGVNVTVERGETLGIIGETGSGKTMLALALVGLLPPGVRIGSGEVALEGQRIDTLRGKDARRILGHRIALMFQDASSSLNPVFTVGHQLTDVLRHVRGLAREDARARALELLELVEIRNARQRFDAYPFELSGGMRQRVLFALALACEADLLVADEPTTALDTVIQAQMVQLMLRLQREFEFGLVFISHDIRLVGEMATRVLVLYAGRPAEYGRSKDVLSRPVHPYTEALMQCVPGEQQRPTPLPSLRGQLPDLLSRGDACLFSPRCDRSTKMCATSRPGAAHDGVDHWGNCIHPLIGDASDA